jgi:hypothetical protein
MKRLLPVGLLAVVLLSACGADRPEGVVERWLISLNQGKAGEPEKYASDALSEQILPHWESRDPGDLDVIEVGKAVKVDNIQSARAIPFRVERASGKMLHGTADVERASGAWRVTRVLFGPQSLRVPSEGGAPIAGASGAAWLGAIGISAALMLLVILAMRLTPEPIALPTQRN